MKNVDMKLSGNIFTTTEDITKEYGLSISTKSMIRASTEGNVLVSEKEGVKIGLNINRKP